MKRIVIAGLLGLAALVPVMPTQNWGCIVETPVSADGRGKPCGGVTTGVYHPMPADFAHSRMPA